MHQFQEARIWMILHNLWKKMDVLPCFVLVLNVYQNVFVAQLYHATDIQYDNVSHQGTLSPRTHIPASLSEIFKLFYLILHSMLHTSMSCKPW